MDTINQWSTEGIVDLKKSKTEQQLSFVWTAASDVIDSLLTYSSTWTAGNASNSGEIDVVEIIGCLSTLYNFVLNKLLPNIISAKSSQTPSSPAAASAPVKGSSQPVASTATAAAASNATNTEVNQNTAVAQISSVSTLILVNEVRNKLLGHLDTFVEDQYNWIVDQKSDPKRAGVAPPVARYVALLHQIQDMMDKQVRILPPYYLKHKLISFYLQNHFLGNSIC